MLLSHQDWNPVVWNKTDEKKNNKTVYPAGNKKFQELDSDEPEAPKPVGLSVGKQIQQARMKLKMTQKQLAQKINEKANVIQDYESGKAIPNPSVKRKIATVLNIKFQ